MSATTANEAREHLAPRIASLADVEAWLQEVEAALRRAAHSDEPLIAKMVGDLIAAGGKRLRPRIGLLAFAACGGADVPRAIQAAAAGELIHTASLVHDDIIDQSPLRRGRPTLHVAYGIPHAIVAGDFLFTRGFAIAGQLPPNIVAVNAHACIQLAEGEVLEQRLLDDEMDEARYMEVIRKKTAEPLGACARAGAMLADAPPHVIEALGQFGLELGIAFQIADDILDIAGNPAETGKVVGQDAKTGVLTLPVGLGSDANAFRAMAREVDPSELRDLLQKNGAIDRARAVALKHAERGKSYLDVLPPSAPKDELLAIADSVVTRRK